MSCFNQHTRICLIAKISGKTKIPKLRFKNALFGYFWQKKMPHLGIFGLEFEILSYLKSANTLEFADLQNFAKTNVLFGYFWGRILKKYCHIWNKHPRLCQTWVFNSYSEFWYRFHFFIRSGLHFFWRFKSGSAL